MKTIWAIFRFVAVLAALLFPQLASAGVPAPKAETRVRAIEIVVETSLKATSLCEAETRSAEAKFAVEIASRSPIRPRGGALRSESAGALNESLGGPLYKQEVMSRLMGGTTHSRQVAQAMKEQRIVTSFFSDDMFAKAYAYRGGTGAAPQAFAYGDKIYIRTSSRSAFTDVVHEGTHALDYLNPKYWGSSAHHLEKRAYFYERQFQMSQGGPVEFGGLDEILQHINRYY